MIDLTTQRSVAVLGHSNVQRSDACGFSDDFRCGTLLRPRTGALQADLSHHHD